MFGYVTPCKMELKIKDYEKFKAYYCGLCKSIKNSYGNLPRLALNYDMTFLGLLLDSLSDEKVQFKISRCPVHPFKKRLYVSNNKALDFAARMNVNLMYYKTLDDIQDEARMKDKILSSFLNLYIKKDPNNLCNIKQLIKKELETLNKLEANCFNIVIDELSHPFANLTANILTSYDALQLEKSEINLLYWFGYNLGKWIYLIDALDDLKEDMTKKRFNALESVFNSSNLEYTDFYKTIKERIEFLLISCASQCMENLMKLTLKNNKDLIINIVQFGMMEKMDMVFNPEKYNKKDIQSNL